MNNDFRTANPDERLNSQPSNGWLYIQWHHGTDQRSDPLPDGGWLIEQAKYPDRNFSLATGRVRFGDAWIAERLSLAFLATKTRWFVGTRGGDVTEVAKYQEGAWSKLHCLVYVQEVDDVAVLTLAGSASRDLGRQLRAYAAGPLAVARRSVPAMPPSGFWNSVGPGPAYLAGSSQTSRVTPPILNLPGALPSSPTKAQIAEWAAGLDADEVSEWLNLRYVGQALLDRFAALLPEVDRFRQADNHYGDDGEEEDREAVPAPTEADRFAAFMQKCDEYGIPQDKRRQLMAAAGNDFQAAMGMVVLYAREDKPRHDLPLPAPAPIADATGSDPAFTAGHLVREIQNEIRDLRLVKAGTFSGKATALQFQLWRDLVTSVLGELGCQRVTALLAGQPLAAVQHHNYTPDAADCAAWLHWLCEVDSKGQAIRPFSIKPGRADDLDLLVQAAPKAPQSQQEPVTAEEPLF